MGGQLATGSSIYMASAGVPAADGAGLSSIKSFSQLLTSIAAMPLAGGTFIGHVLFTDNTYDIGASGATRPRTVYAGTSVITPLLNNTNAAALTLGNATYGVTVPGALTVGSNVLVNAAAGFSGYILDMQVDGVSKYRFNTNGAITLPGSYEIYSDSSRMQFGPASNAKLSLTSTELRSVNGYGYSTSVDVPASLFTVRDAANTLAQRNGTNAQTSRLYNTYTSSTSFENLQTSWVSNEARIGTSVGSAGGTQRNLVIGAWDSAGSFMAGMTLAPAGAATFSGDISMSKTSAQGYIRAYGTGGVNNIAMYDDNTNGILSTSSGNLNLVPTGGTVAVTGAGTFSSTVDAVRYGISGWSFRPSPTASGSAAIYDDVNSRETMRLNPQGNAYFLNNVYLNAAISGEAGIMMQQSGVDKWQVYDAASSFRIYNFTTAANAMTIAAATSNATFAGGITASGVVSHGAYTVATLPAAGSNAGKMAQVTDSNVAASGNYGATVAAGGANRVKVFSDGTNWVIA